MQEIKIFANGQDSSKTSSNSFTGNQIIITGNNAPVHLTIIQTANPDLGNENPKQTKRKSFISKLISFLSSLHLTMWLVDFFPWILIGLIPVLNWIFNTDIPTRN